jgi:hypothetical protein
VRPIEKPETMSSLPSFRPPVYDETLPRSPRALLRALGWKGTLSVIFKTLPLILIAALFFVVLIVVRVVFWPFKILRSAAKKQP